MNGPALLEICVDGPDGVAAAVAGGADRIELCAALELGGLTPSAAFVAVAVGAGVPIHAMVRPRGGDFRYDVAEARLMIDEIGRMRDAGVAGVVVGATGADGALDAALLQRFRRAADGIAITLHRAIDITLDPVAGVRLAGDLGYDMVLSSGGKRTAVLGSETLARMVEAAPPSLAIMAGSGVSAALAVTLMRETGVRMLHASASRLLATDAPSLVVEGFGFGERRVTDRSLVAALKAAMMEYK